MADEKILTAMLKSSLSETITDLSPYVRAVNEQEQLNFIQSTPHVASQKTFAKSSGDAQVKLTIKNGDSGNVGLGLGLGPGENGNQTPFSWLPNQDVNVIGWFKAQDNTTITPVAGFAAQVNNKFGSMSALTSAKPPLITTGALGKQCFSFNGVDQYLQCTKPANASETYFIVFEPDNETLIANNPNVLLSTRTTGGGAGFAITGKTYALTTDRKIQTEGAGTSGYVLTNKGGNTSNIYLSSLNEPCFIMGQYAAGGTQTTLRLCSYTNGNFFGKHKVYEFITVQGQPSQDLTNRILWYLNNEYGQSGWAARPLNIFSKAGQVIAKPAEMTSGNGCYYSMAVDMSSVPNFPRRYAVYFSTDHAAGNGGIYLYITNDLTNQSNYKSYTQAVIDGDFNYLSTKPSANPIYVDTIIGNQTETPEVRVIDGTVVLTYQNAGAGNNQSTIRAKGVDGVNFTRDKIIIDYDNFTPAVAEIGDAHTGYFKWNVNKFSGVPYRYVGYSLHGGQTKPVMAQWGSNDPVNGDWYLVDLMHRVAGRAKPPVGRFLEWNSIDLNTVRQMPDGNYLVLCDYENPSAGGGARDGALYEVILDSSGRTVVSQPIEVIPRGASGFDQGEVAGASIITTPTLITGVYIGADTINAKTVGAVSGLIRDPALAYYPPLSPAIPPYTQYTYDFSTMNALPQGFTFVQSGASLSWDSTYGVKITCTTGGYGYIYIDRSFLPTSAKYVEIFFGDWRTFGTGYNVVPTLGFGEVKDIPANVVNGFYWDNGATTANAYRNTRTAGILTSVVDNLYNGFGYSNFYANQRKQIGIRWFVDSGLMYPIGFSRNEFDVSIVNIPDTTKTYTPFFGVSSPLNAATESFKFLTVCVSN